MNELMELKRKVEQRRSAVPPSQATSAKTGIQTLIPVLNITMINGGVKHNIVPDRCSIEGDRRFIPEETLEDVCQG